MPAPPPGAQNTGQACLQRQPPAIGRCGGPLWDVSYTGLLRRREQARGAMWQTGSKFRIRMPCMAVALDTISVLVLRFMVLRFMVLRFMVLRFMVLRFKK